MHSSFDILKKNPEGSFCRFEAVNDLASANIRIKELTTSSPATPSSSIRACVCAITKLSGCELGRKHSLPSVVDPET